MPTVHLGQLQLALEKNSHDWQVFIQPQPEAHWKVLKPSYAWAFELLPHEGRDLVELRMPAWLYDQDYGEFTVAAETVIGGNVVGAWTFVGDWLCSAPFASVQELYVRVEVTPKNGELPLSVPNGGTARGGGHFHVKTAGGGDKGPGGGGK